MNLPRGSQLPRESSKRCELLRIPLPRRWMNRQRRVSARRCARSEKSSRVRPVALGCVGELKEEPAVIGELKEEPAVIRDVSLTRVFVNDQQAALEFYTEKLGLEKIQDEPYGEGTRWITVSPAGSRIMIALEKAEQDYEKAQVGRSEGRPVLVLSTNDLHASYERLRERGVRFLEEVVRYPWGGIGAR